MEALIEVLNDLEIDPKFDLAKETMKDRQKYRAQLRELLEEELELPRNTTVYAGITNANGRVSYRAVAEDLKQRYNVPDSVYDDILEDNRGTGGRLKYGHRSQLGDKKMQQLEFKFMTPSTT